MLPGPGLRLCQSLQFCASLFSALLCLFESFLLDEMAFVGACKVVPSGKVSGGSNVCGRSMFFGSAVAVAPVATSKGEVLVLKFF